MTNSSYLPTAKLRKVLAEKSNYSVSLVGLKSQLKKLKMKQTLNKSSKILILKEKSLEQDMKTS